MERYAAAERSFDPFQLTDGQEKIYVSAQSGNDSASGTYNAPVKTLEKALELAESVQADEICMRGGVYYVSDTVNISYSADWYKPLRISAYKNESVTINGGADIRLSDMVPASDSFTDKIINKPDEGKILQYSLKAAGITDYGEISRRGHLISEDKEAQAELSIGGSVQKLAGWPNDEFTGLKSVDEYGTRSKKGIADGCSFTVDYDRPSQWSRQSDVWLSGTLGPNYEFDYYPVKSFDKENKRFYLREGAVMKYYTSPYFRFENIPEELDAPGEYYIDREEGMLYFYPPQNADKDAVLTLTMPVRSTKNASVNSLIRLEGCRNIIFENLTFKGGRGSAVTGNGNHGISFINCDINSFGAHGIRLDASGRITVRGNRIHDVGQNGVEFTKCGNYGKIIPSYNLVCNNDIYNFARLERSYKAGIIFGYQCVGASAARNHIHDGPHTGMIFYGVNNEIYGNEFDNLVTEFSDMDALYANNSNYPWERGNMIYGNYFHDIGKSTMNGVHQINVRAIRTDNKGCGLNVFGNLFVGIGDGKNNNNIGAVTAEGTHNKIVNNLFVDCSETYINTQKYVQKTADENGCLYADNDTINGVKVSELKKETDNYLAVYGAHFPELYNFFKEHPNCSKTNEFKNNVIVNIAFPLSTYNDNAQNEVQLNAEGYRGNIKLTDASGNYVGTSDPGFADYENGNFELSQKLADGFPNMIMSSFGLIK